MIDFAPLTDKPCDMCASFRDHAFHPWCLKLSMSVEHARVNAPGNCGLAGELWEEDKQIAVL